MFPRLVAGSKGRAVGVRRGFPRETQDRLLGARRHSLHDGGLRGHVCAHQGERHVRGHSEDGRYVVLILLIFMKVWMFVINHASLVEYEIR